MVCALLLLAVYVATAARSLETNDVLSATLEGWRIATSGHPWFDGLDLRGVASSPDQVWNAVAPNGHLVAFRSPGVVAASVPAYLFAGHAVGGYSVFAGAAWASVLTVLAVCLLGSSLRTYLLPSQRVVAAGVIALATPVWSVSADGIWPHTVTVLGIAGMAWAASRDRWELLGLFGGVALWGRLHAVLVVVVMGLGLAAWRRRPAIAVRVGVPAAAMMALASVWTHWLYGSWSPAGGYFPSATAYASGTTSGPSMSKLTNELGLWISPGRGLLVWTPVLLLLLLPVLRSWHGLPDWSRLLLLGGLLYSTVQGLLNSYVGGDGFYGYRLMLEMLACAFPACALAAGAMGRRSRAWLGPVLGLQTAAIGLGAISNGFYTGYDTGWKDNSVWLAVRTYPVLGLLMVLMALVGTLALVSVRQRRLLPPWPDLTGAARPRDVVPEVVPPVSGGLDDRRRDRAHQA